MHMQRKQIKEEE